ncbi:non-hydrolyzing UDP-N-acetylglucosamine 2-epimerase [Streptomyces chiangmaiensis]|uniref:UDP-N-acetylglucosamine 2-epimerase (non-hydrolyzing) n=1 Tax=Streptomyces chiangmaiensis TaxID=766497 RepID=A0ABU7FQ89_9ACTN|nr:UDP-N-acetylglucosamine 2-epimerase (non-hydrolyzing) [Streptomyces chiangmaiensis]MED7825294.1 UDP-N-acetylglucosamine 2-epimerase (non-hydrolyzing) [Streptomyces chiangmaiensis]
MKRLMVIYGTRPEAIKMAPVIEALEKSPMFRATVAVTAQHRGLLDQVHALFGIRADHDLDILSQRQSLADITIRVLDGICPLLQRESPDAVLVQGDTTTAFAGALAAFYSQIPVVHLEAGLRTDDRYCPFPEEINRRLATQLASLHLAPTWQARDNLLREGVLPSSVVVTGNTVIDALRWAVGRKTHYGDPALADLDDTTRRVLLVTAHRRESWGSGMESIGGAVADLARTEPELLIVLPLHPNPVVRAAILPQVTGLESVRLTEPLAYGAFARLMNRAHLILTDSGGIQEEGPGLGKPVLVMRDTTERPEAVRAGTSRLVGTDREHIVKQVRLLLHDRAAHAAMARAVNPYGDGCAADRTVRAIGHWMGLCGRPAEFGSEPDGAGGSTSAPESASAEHGLAAQRGPLDASEAVMVHEQHNHIRIPHRGGVVDEFGHAGACQ